MKPKQLTPAQAVAEIDRLELAARQATDLDEVDAIRQELHQLAEVLLADPQWRKLSERLAGGVQ